MYLHLFLKIGVTLAIFNFEGNTPEQKKFYLPVHCATVSLFYILNFAAILLVKAKKSLIFHHFESVEISFFFDLKFILFRLFFILVFAAEAGIVHSLFFDFGQKQASFSYKIIPTKKMHAILKKMPE